ncbi:MAG: M20 family metallopeptidase [Actinomycetota bacterium]
MTPAGPPAPTDIHQLRKLAEASLDQYLDDLRTLVDIDCGTYIPAGVNRVADFMQSRFRERGWTVDRIHHSPEKDSAQLGDLLVAKLQGPRAGGRRVLLVGHMDTVFPEGTALERPLRIEGSTAYGPGVSDMKGGLLGGYHAVASLQDAGFEDFGSITYVCNPDEEIGSPFSGPFILEQARDADVCFVLEGARENGDIVSSRKGVKDIRMVFNGRAAHAGVEPERGRSATLQAAHTTIALQELNGRWPGVTVNVGVIQGGTRPNVVAERCELQVDVRAVTAKDFDEALTEVERRARETVVSDVTVEIVTQSGFPPMEKTEATARLVDRAKELAAELGFEVNDAATGGASDANPVAGMGVPTLDGLGPIGGADHAPGEWLDLESVVPRVSLLAGLIASSP